MYGDAAGFEVAEGGVVDCVLFGLVGHSAAGLVVAEVEDEDAEDVDDCPQADAPYGGGAEEGGGLG